MPSTVRRNPNWIQPPQHNRGQQRQREDFSCFKSALLLSSLAGAALYRSPPTVAFDPLLGAECRTHIYGVAERQGFNLRDRNIVVESPSSTFIENPGDLIVPCGNPPCSEEKKIRIPLDHCVTASDTYSSTGTYDYRYYSPSNFLPLLRIRELPSRREESLPLLDLGTAVYLSRFANKDEALPDDISLKADYGKIFAELLIHTSAETVPSELLQGYVETPVKKDPSVGRKVYDLIMGKVPTEEGVEVLTCGDLDDMKSLPFPQFFLNGPPWETFQIGIANCAAEQIKTAVCDAAPKENPDLCDDGPMFRIWEKRQQQCKRQ